MSHGPPEPGVGAVEAPTMAEVARGVSWKAVSRVAGQGTWYASLIVLAILLPPEDFGIIAVGTVVMTATTLLMESGTGGSIVLMRDLRTAYLRRSVRRTFLAGVAFTLVAAALAQPLVDTFANGADPDVLRVMMLSVTFAALAVVPMALLERTLHFKRLAVIAIAAAVVASVASVAVAALGAGVWALVVRLVLYQLILAALAWVAVRDLFPRAHSLETGDRPEAVGAHWFVVMAAANFLALSFDNLIVGSLTDVTQLGLYALAFALAFVPLTQISWDIGAVLFPAIAATRDLDLITRRALKALRLMALMLLPLVPAGIALAPAVIPTLLGEKWQGMVAPFQILLVVGVGHGIANVLAETLSGSGNIAVRARIDVLWAAGSIGAVIVATEAAGIRGAAAAHVVAFCGLAFAYVGWGARRLGLTPPQLLHAVSGVAGCVALQALATACAGGAISVMEGGTVAAGIGGAAAGIAALGAALRWLQPALLQEGREVLTAAAKRRLA